MSGVACPPLAVAVPSRIICKEAVSFCVTIPLPAVPLGGWSVLREMLSCSPLEKGKQDLSSHASSCGLPYLPGLAVRRITRLLPSARAAEPFSETHAPAWGRDGSETTDYPGIMVRAREDEGRLEASVLSSAPERFECIPGRATSIAMQQAEMEHPLLHSRTSSLSSSSASTPSSEASKRLQNGLCDAAVADATMNAVRAGQAPPASTALNFASMSHSAANGALVQGERSLAASTIWVAAEVAKSKDDLDHAGCMLFAPVRLLSARHFPTLAGPQGVGSRALRTR